MKLSLSRTAARGARSLEPSLVSKVLYAARMRGASSWRCCVSVTGRSAALQAASGHARAGSRCTGPLSSMTRTSRRPSKEAGLRTRQIRKAVTGRTRVTEAGPSASWGCGTDHVIRKTPSSSRHSCAARVHPSAEPPPVTHPNGCNGVNKLGASLYINAVFVRFVGEMSILY